MPFTKFGMKLQTFSRVLARLLVTRNLTALAIYAFVFHERFAHGFSNEGGVKF